MKRKKFYFYHKFTVYSVGFHCTTSQKCIEETYLMKSSLRMFVRVQPTSHEDHLAPQQLQSGAWQETTRGHGGDQWPQSGDTGCLTPAQWRLQLCGQ